MYSFWKQHLLLFLLFLIPQSLPLTSPNQFLEANNQDVLCSSGAWHGFTIIIIIYPD